MHAGQGGTFTESVPVLVIGGLLTTGALAAAVRRIRPRASAGTG
ncbi:hypothetical protein [Streptomyces sp. NPDC047079]